MKTKIFAALLCAMCIGLIGCTNNGNAPENSSSNVGIRQAQGHTIYEVTIEGKQMWFSRKTDAIDTTKVYLTSHYSYYQEIDDKKKYSGDFVVPSSFNALGVTFHVIGLQDPLGTTLLNANVCPFNKCDKLTSVTLPISFTYISPWAFSNLNKLTSINFPNTIDSICQGAIRGCHCLKTLNLPPNLRILEQVAISCDGIKEITIPASVIKSYGSSIAGCDSLEIAHVLSATPTELDMFGANQNLKHIYVPSANVNAYKSAWTQHADIIEAENN